jgi:hypothetical protein
VKLGAICFWDFSGGITATPADVRAQLGDRWFPPRVERIANVRRTGRLGPADLTRIFVSNITKRMHGITLKDTGGLYYVPPRHVEALRAHEKAARALCGRFVVLDLADTPGNASALSGAARGALAAHAEALAEQARQAAIDPPRPSTLRRRLASLKDLARILTHYEDLGVDLAGTVATAIATIEGVLADRYGIRTARIVRKQRSAS